MISSIFFYSGNVTTFSTLKGLRQTGSRLLYYNIFMYIIYIIRWFQIGEC